MHSVASLLSKAVLSVPASHCGSTLKLLLVDCRRFMPGLLGPPSIVVDLFVVSRCCARAEWAVPKASGTFSMVGWSRED
jgi:hypothetical protein